MANGHAAEVSSLSREERRRALALALDEVGGRCPIVAGVYTDGTREAVELAHDAKAEGAAGVLVFPPTLFMWGAQLKPEMVLRHFSEIAAGADLPIVVFEYPPASGIGYAPETLARLAEIPQVAAVKDWSNDIIAYERNLRALRASGRPVAMLSSYTLSLMVTFLLDGAISASWPYSKPVPRSVSPRRSRPPPAPRRRLAQRLAATSPSPCRPGGSRSLWRRAPGRTCSRS